MALQFSVAVRNARLDAVELTIGATPTLELRSGAPPANCAAGDSGTLLASLVLPADWMANAASGSKGIAGSWSGNGAVAGTIGHFRLKTASVCHLQGSVGQTVGAGGTGVGDMLLDNPVIAVTQAIAVSAFSLSEANA